MHFFELVQFEGMPFFTNQLSVVSSALALGLFFFASMAPAQAIDFQNYYRFAGATFSEDRSVCTDDCNTYRDEKLKLFSIDEAGNHTEFLLRGSQFSLVKIALPLSEMAQLPVQADALVAQPAGLPPQKILKISARVQLKSVAYRDLTLENCSAFLSPKPLKPYPALVVACRKINLSGDNSPEWVVELKFERRPFQAPIHSVTRVAEF